MPWSREPSTAGVEPRQHSTALRAQAHPHPPPKLADTVSVTWVAFRSLPQEPTVFLALRDLRFARGRFLLMGAVVGLMAVLAVILSGLSNGLVQDGVSGLRALPVTHLGFQPDVSGDAFSRSTVEQSAWQRAASTPGVRAAAPYGNQLAHAKIARNGAAVDLALFGVEPGSFLAPTPVTGHPLGSEPDGVLVSSKLTKAGVKVGDTLVIDRVGVRLPVIGTIGDDSFGHVAVAYAPLRTWQQVHYGLPGQVPAEAYRQATAVALQLTGGADPAAVGRATGTHVVGLSASFAYSPGFTAETSTMTLIQVFLYLISTLVVGAFFVVWTLQRGSEIALVKALGASSGYLVRDALAQAAVVLIGAVAVGALVGVGLGSLMGGMPFQLRAAPVSLAAGLLIVLGLAGAAVAVRRITSVDPLLALGAHR